MFFYVSIFIACVISAFLIIYLFHALVDVVKVVFKGLQASPKDKVTGHLGSVTTANGTQTPWGWEGSYHETRTQRPRNATPNGMSGLDGYLNNVGSETTSVGWPHREDKVESTGRAYKVTRRTASNKTRLRTGGAQPWGW